MRSIQTSQEVDDQANKSDVQKMLSPCEQEGAIKQERDFIIYYPMSNEISASSFHFFGALDASGDRAGRKIFIMMIICVAAAAKRKITPLQNKWSKSGFKFWTFCLRVKFQQVHGFRF